MLLKPFFDSMRKVAELGYSPTAKMLTLAAYERVQRALRGVCELNSCRWQETVLEAASSAAIDRKNDLPNERPSFYGSGTRIRTQTYRVRVCCATFTQFRYRRFDFVLDYFST